MEDLSRSISCVTQELHNLQKLLESSKFHCSDPSAQNRVLDDLVDIGLVRNLKNAVDQMRHFLWNYIDSASALGQLEGADPVRLDHATHMLHMLHSSPFPYYKSSFIERITAAVDSRLEEAGAERELAKQAAA